MGRRMFTRACIREHLPIAPTPMSQQTSRPPRYIKKLVKLIELVVPLRRAAIRFRQRRLLKRYYSKDCRRLIVFFTPGSDSVSGGILSISSLYHETARLRVLHGSEVVLCSIPNEPLLLEYTKFNNNHYIYSPPEVFRHFRLLDRLLMHVPEYCAAEFISFANQYANYFAKIASVQINILLQNIDLAPEHEVINTLSSHARLTCTTAHQAYSNDATAQRLGCPVHKLSTYVSPELYVSRSYREKQNMLIVSPDPHPARIPVLNILKAHFPLMQIVIVEGMTYEQYKKVIGRARWALTFGEGLDGYFVESIFSGTVAFAVYNDRFFSQDFKTLHTVYPSYSELAERISTDIQRLDDEAKYTAYQKMEYSVCASHYQHEKYVANLAKFYDHYYGR